MLFACLHVIALASTSVPSLLPSLLASTFNTAGGIPFILFGIIYGIYYSHLCGAKGAV